MDRRKNEKLLEVAMKVWAEGAIPARADIAGLGCSLSWVLSMHFLRTSCDLRAAS